MRQISLLDCTLRDGGFLNDWNFSKNTILSIFRRLVKANIDIIEIGFINENYCFDENRTINPDTKSFDKIFGNEKKGNSLIVAMIDLGTCSIDKISDKKESFIDGIRVIFKKKDMHSAINFCKQLQDKGYKISVQPVSITTYSDRDMLDLIDLVNELNPYAMSLVDTYGLLYKDRLLKYFSLLDNNLNSNISIGYHAHDNFKLSFANASELLRIQTRRKLIIDCSLYGMGKSAGNLNTELISDYLNKQYGKNYDILEIINAIELEILRFLKDCKWGYQLPLYVSAINECHPNYVKYLGTKNTISMKEISEIITEIDKDKRLSFNKEHIEQLYLKYQSKNLDDSKEYEKLSKIFKDKTILLIGPGNSVKKEQIKIKEYINKNNVITFGVNHINTIFDINYISFKYEKTDFFCTD